MISTQKLFPCVNLFYIIGILIVEIVFACVGYFIVLGILGILRLHICFLQQRTNVMGR
jgi:hypothetical protein